jgi:CubicO group peptidase (beta-lactamase class C family)
MRHLLLATLLASAAVPAFAADAALDPIVHHWMQAARIRGAAIAHVRHGKLESVHVYGERAPGVPLTEDARFNVASLTKPVFAVLTLGLVADGKLSLDSKLAEHWVDPDVADDARRLALTPRLTLSHQSGLPNWRREKLAFDFAPGERHEYSGEGYEYTRRAIEELTGQSMGALMRTRVLAPAGMTATSFGWDPAIAGHEVTGFDAKGEPLPTADLAGREANAAAHMFTTIGDYARFARWVADGAALPRALQREMATPQARHADPAEHFGLGWRVVRVGAHTVLSHDGREKGVRTQVFVRPDVDEALVILTNSDHGELLVHPVVAATFADGAALNHQVGVDTWHFLRSQPRQALEPMMQGITRSPSFMAKLLYAADATLVEGAGLDAAARQRALAAIDPFVLGMVDGSVGQPQAQALFERLVQATAGGPQLRGRFDAAQAVAWTQALEAAATRAVAKD